ncbi:MAG: hypothetical protein ABL908_06705 [Hyphomicrobium sp.]
MSLQKAMPWLAGLLVASVAVMWWAAAHDTRMISAVAAFGFVAAIVVTAQVVNAAAAHRTDHEPRAQFHMLRRNMRLTALVYAWGAAAMMAVYVIGDLKWRHGWQYGAAMALVAGALLWLVDRLGRPGNTLDTPGMFSRVVPLTLAHAITAAAGLYFLVGSGKLATVKGDWAANHVFLAGGLGIVALALIAARTHRRLARDRT